LVEITPTEITPTGITSPGPDRRALFCVHPVGGNVLCYFDLARALGPDQPFYGLQLPSSPALHSIEEMAAHYLEAVRAVQPQGPYLLAGWSVGGIVAFEMARQLTMMGTVSEETSLLVLIDTPRPFRDWEVWDPDEPLLISLFAKDLAATQGRDFVVTMSVAELLELPPDQRLQRVLFAAQTARLLPPGISGAEAERLFAMYRTIQEAVQKYQPGSWPGRAVALLATEGAFGEQEDSAAGWPELITGGLAVERIEGDHYSILRRPGVSDLAARLAAYLAQSGTEGGEA
jgi:thioesterase domain-containing protein